MKRIGLLFIVMMVLMAVVPLRAADEINYTSQPDDLVVFLNDIALARDEVTLPGGVNVRVVLPSQVFPDTLILREDGERVPAYRLSRGNDGLMALSWTSGASGDTRQVTLDYLLSGVGWSPKYDMWLGDEDAETVELDFYAQIRNPALALDDVRVKLVAGQVDTAQALGDVSRVTANQYLAGYEQEADGNFQTFTGAATIQYVYEIGSVTAQQGEVVYTRLQENTFAARRLHLWNAPASPQVAVIYKVRNDSELPLAEGIVRTYQGDLFLGSDFIELTPIGSEGSVTVGNLRNVRVNRTESVTRVESSSSRNDDLHEIVLTLENFGDADVEIEVVDRYPQYAVEFDFAQTPQREGNNVLRWVVTVEAGTTTELRYMFKD
jgi:hypothetical protein